MKLALVLVAALACSACSATQVQSDVRYARIVTTELGHICVTLEQDDALAVAVCDAAEQALLAGLDNVSPPQGARILIVPHADAGSHD